MNVEVVMKKLKYLISSIKQSKPLVATSTSVKEGTFVRRWRNVETLKALTAVSAKPGLMVTHVRTSMSVLMEQIHAERKHNA